MTSKIPPIFPDEYRETELYEAAAAEEARQDAVEHNFHIHINTRATENRAAQLQQAQEEATEAARAAQQAQEARRQAAAKKAKEARQKAKRDAFYLRIACSVLTAAIANILMQIGAVSPGFALVVSLAALAKVGWELFWIIRGAIRFWTRKEERNA